MKGFSMPEHPSARALALAALLASTMPATAASSCSSASDDGAAEHASLKERVFVWSLVANVGREGAAEHEGAAAHGRR
jgi:hypothetical protein